MDIEGAGWKVLEQLLQTGLVKRRGDFFRLSVEDLEGLERFARKSAENLHAAIQKARRRPLERIIAALGIPQVGWTTAIELAHWLAAEVAGGATSRLARRGGRAPAARSRRDAPERFEEIEGIGPTVVGGARGLVRARRPGRGRPRGPRRRRGRGRAARRPAAGARRPGRSPARRSS